MAKTYGMAPAEGPGAGVPTLPRGVIQLPCGTAFRLFTDEPFLRVYFIENVETGHIKLGRSYDPIERLRALQTGNHCRLRLLGSIPGDASTEIRVHNLIYRHQLRSEWFLPRVRPIADALLRCARGMDAKDALSLESARRS